MVWWVCSQRYKARSTGITAQWKVPPSGESIRMYHPPSPQSKQYQPN